MNTPGGWLILAILIFGEKTAISQSVDERFDDLAATDYFDAFCIANVAHIFWNSTLPDCNNAVKDLSRILPVDRAERHGAPDSSTQALIDLTLGYENQFHPKAISAINLGDSGYIWKVEHNLSIKFGGSSGVPFTYISYVNADGSLILPSRYLISRKRIDLETNLYSVLSFTDLETSASKKSTVDGEDALRLAKSQLDTLCAKAKRLKISLSPRFHDQQLVQYPFATTNAGHHKKCDVWAVRFSLVDNAGNGLVDDSRIIVWVTSNGLVSTLSLDSWQAIPIQKKVTPKPQEQPQTKDNGISTAQSPDDCEE